MPLAVTHIILAIVLVSLYRDYFTKHKKYFPLLTITLAGFAGLLPDIDIPLNMILDRLGYTFSWLQHGGITHTPLFGLLFLLPAVYFWQKKRHKLAIAFGVITFGILLHILLDFVIGGGAAEGIMILWPFSTASFKLHLIKRLGIDNLPQAIDALILLAWLFHEEIKHKIKDFI